jgi:hypothetical protein
MAAGSGETAAVLREAAGKICGRGLKLVSFQTNL